MIRKTRGERIGLIIIYSVLFVMMTMTLYPFWHVLMYSISVPRLALRGGLFFVPKGLSKVAYALVLQTKGLIISYGNTIFRTVVGTAINILITATIAYPLSVRRLRGRSFVSMMIFFTMLFSGGMIPTYLLVRNLGLLDNRFSLILPTAISAYNMFIMRNYFQSLPASLEESATIDGANPIRILVSIILPISMPVIAAIMLFYGVFHWNAFFDSILYINTTSKQVLQVFLRVMYQSGAINTLSGSEGYEHIQSATEDSIRMATIAVSVIPMLIIYPFLQKYYVKGVLIGSVKG